MTTAFSPAVTIAIPIWQQRVSPVLDTAMRLLIVHCCKGRQTGRKEHLLGPMTTGAFAGSMVELQVDVLLCGGVSEVLMHALEQRGVKVWPHLCGEVEDILRAFDCGKLDGPAFRMPGCHGGHGREMDCRRHRGLQAGKLRARKTRPAPAL